jgi:NADH:ubiquinone oxidoreductase subunit 5 (subunit L)/multisubunit Na+/H+ antiporter MnhA subunit
MSDKKDIPDPTQESSWGDNPEDNFGYKDNNERLNKRGLEDWEMVEKMGESDVSIPYWFIAIFVVLLLVAIGLTFPFWGNRPGFERPWFDWGIPAGAAWVIAMSFLIYYFVDLRHVFKERKRRKQQEQDSKVEEKDDAN